MSEDWSVFGRQNDTPSQLDGYLLHILFLRISAHDLRQPRHTCIVGSVVVALLVGNPDRRNHADIGLFVRTLDAKDGQQ